MRALLGLGANLGDPVATLNEAKERLTALGRVTAVSALYRTPPWGLTEQPPFVNAALALETALDPDALLVALKALERDLGRVASVRWGPRAIDVDILAVDGVKRDDPAPDDPACSPLRAGVRARAAGGDRTVFRRRA